MTELGLICGYEHTQISPESPFTTIRLFDYQKYVAMKTKIYLATKSEIARIGEIMQQEYLKVCVNL